MTIIGRHSLIIGCSRFDDSGLSALPAAEKDAGLISDLLHTTKSIEAGSARVLINPVLAEALRAIDEAARQAANAPNGSLFLYIASHAVANADGTLFLFMRDSLLDAKATTCLSTSLIGDVIVERRVPTSVTTLDVCHADSYGDLLGRVVASQRLAGSKSEVASDGHYLIAACSANETSKEGKFGGRFTQVLLATIADLGRHNPRLVTLPTHMVAAATISAAESEKLPQTPRWSGLSVRASVPFCANVDHNQNAPAGHPPVTVTALSDSDRTVLRDAVADLHAAASMFGSTLPWSSEAGRAMRFVMDHRGTDLSDDGALVFTERAINSVLDRLGKAPSFSDTDELISFAEQCCATLIAVPGGTDAATLSLCYGLTSISAHIEDQLRSVNLDPARKWYSDFGMASIALAPIFLSDAVGKACFLHYAALAVGDNAAATRFAQFATEKLAENPKLWRVTWTGQLVDIVTICGITRQSKGELTKDRIRSMLEYRIDSANAVRKPITAIDGSIKLGRDSAKFYLGGKSDSREYSDESIATLLSLASYCGSGTLDQNAIAGNILQNCKGDNTVVFELQAFEAQASRGMESTTLWTWPLGTPERVTQLLQESGGLLVKMQKLVPTPKHRFLSIGAARLHRNRSPLWALP